MKRKRTQAIVDMLLIGVSILLAYLIVKSDAVHTISAFLHGLGYVGAFLAGVMFTSVFTIAPSIAILAELSQESSIWMVALWGGLGAMIGDYILFRFIKDRFSEDLDFIFRHSKIRRVKAVFKTRLFRLFSPFIGGLVIISPLPDEIGLAILGFSKITNKSFFILSFCLNAVGVLMVGFLTR